MVTEIKGLRSEIQEIETKLEMVEKLHENNHSSVRSLSQSTAVSTKAILGLVTIVLVGGVISYTLGLDPATLGNSFTLMHESTISGFNEILKANNANATKTFECLGKNHALIKETSSLITGQLKNLTTNMLHLLSEADINNLQYSNKGDNWK